MRKIISDLLASDPALEVVGTAANGAVALKQIAALEPDVVTLDVEMPVLDGLQTLEKIMQEKPLPVVMLSSLTEAGAETTIKALQKGAVDFVPKPSGITTVDLEKLRSNLINKVKIASQVKVSSRLTGWGELRLFRQPKERRSEQPLQKLVLVGASTGGPKALNELLSRLPGGLPAAFLVVQHMPAGFTRSLAERLDQNSQLRVKEAEEGERVVAGSVYIAPGGYHLQVEQPLAAGSELRLHLKRSEPVNGHRPSVDVLMLSAAKLKGFDLIGVILTGMGHDGCQGMRALKERGARTIAEARDTAVVYGMPRAVVEARLADRVVPLPFIASEIIHMTNEK